MKLGLITDMKDTFLFSDYERLKRIDTFNSLEDIENTMDILIADENHVTIESLIKHIEKNPRMSTIKYIYILLKESSEVKSVLLKNKGVEVIPPGLSREQVASKVKKILYGEGHEKRNNSIIFFGADSKVGTSMIAHSVAEKLSENRDIKVLLAFLDGSPGLDYTRKCEHEQSIDTVRAKIINHILSNNELMGTCLRRDGLYILPGTQSIVYRRYYHPEHIEALMEQLAEAFDVVIVDGGSNIELGMTVGALNSTNHKFLVCTQQRTCLRHFKQIQSQVLSKLEINDFCLIINKYFSNGQLPDRFQLTEEYGAPHICSVPYSEFSLQAEIEGRTIHKFHDPGYKEAINQITSIIGESLGVEVKTKKEISSLFDKVFKYRKENVG